MRALVERCAYAFAGDKLEAGVANLRLVIKALWADAFTADAWAVLPEAQLTATVRDNATGVHPVGGSCSAYGIGGR